MHNSNNLIYHFLPHLQGTSDNNMTTYSYPRIPVLQTPISMSTTLTFNKIIGDNTMVCSLELYVPKHQTSTIGFTLARAQHVIYYWLSMTLLHGGMIFLPFDLSHLLP